MSDFATIRARYDDSADVLYFTIGTSPPAAYQEDDDGLVWRVNAAGVAYGVTIMDYHAYWSRRLGQLSNRISEVLHLDKDVNVRELLSQR